MHKRVREKFNALLDQHCHLWPDALVLDVGSLDLNGSLRATIESRGWKYVGLDVVPGANVDHVARDPYRYSLPECADLIISNATIEHVGLPWRWMRALADCAAHSARVIVMCPWNMEPHATPRDYWRILPDGLAALMDDAGLAVIEAGRDDVYSWAVGVKVESDGSDTWRE